MSSLPSPADDVLQKARHTSLTPDDAAALAARVAELASAGLPLATGLRAAASELRRGPVAEALRRLADETEAGQSLEHALTQGVNRLPPQVRSIVVAGLHSGRLTDVLEQFVANHRRNATLRRHVALALAYPTLVVVLMVAVLWFYGATLAADLVALGKTFDVDILSVHTQALALLGRFGPALAVGGLVVLLLTTLTPRLLGGNVGVGDMAMCWLPLIAPLSRASAQAEFCRLLALLVECRAPLPEALALVAGTLRDERVAQGCRQLAGRVQQGMSLSQAVAESRGISPLLAALVAWHEGTPVLVQSLGTAAELFQERAQQQLDFIRRLAPMAAFVTVLLGIGFLFTAVYAALFSLVETLS